MSPAERENRRRLLDPLARMLRRDIDRTRRHVLGGIPKLLDEPGFTDGEQPHDAQSADGKERMWLAGELWPREFGASALEGLDP